MHLAHDSHLAYCTNIHRGETWPETFAGLRDHVLRVRQRVAQPDEPYAIGLRLSHQAAVELADPATLETFKEWLAEHGCYVFTINGFPYGSFHGSRVKESVYQPDWADRKRVEYTKLLFDLLVEILPDGVAGSVSTVPGSFKGFQSSGEDIILMLDHLKEISDYLGKLSDKSGHDLHLGLEPEPCCLFETSGETLKFFGLLADRFPDDKEILRRIGVNYDTCHLAVEFEEPEVALERLVGSGLRLSKIHLSSALTAKPTPAARERLRDFAEDIYFHQTVVRFDAESPLQRFFDLPEALAWADTQPEDALGDEWRVHFHVPLHADPEPGFGTTSDHIEGALKFLEDQPPGICQHYEMETYTWEVLPESMRLPDVVDQLEKEYQWTLAKLSGAGLR